MSTDRINSDVEFTGTVTGAPIVLHVPALDLVGANAATWYYRHPVGAPTVVVRNIATRLSGALTTGNATITAAISTNGTTFTAVTGGAVTIAQASSAAGDLDDASPTAASTLAAGSTLRLTVGGTNDAVRTAAVSVLLR